MNNNSIGAASKEKTQIPSTFSGKLLINTRTITRTSASFRNITKNRNSGLENFSIEEFSELLVLLEAMSTSVDMHYDGTVPESVLAKTVAEEQSLEVKIGAGNLFSPIAPNTPSQLLMLCKNSAIQAIPIIRQRAGEFSKNFANARKRFPEIVPIDALSASRFKAALLADLPPVDEQWEAALKIIVDNEFIGSKCVAALRIVEPSDHYDEMGTASDIRTIARELVRNHSGSELALIVPMLINAFRSNFMNCMGSDCADAALFAGPEIENVIDQQVFLLSNYVASRLCKKKLDYALSQSLVGKQLRTTDHFPFLGLMTFLAAPDGDPYGVFRTALDDRDILTNRVMAKLGPQVRFCHQLNSKELADFKTEKLESIYRILTVRSYSSAGIAKLGGYLDCFHTRFVLPSSNAYVEFQRLLKPLAAILSSGGVEIDPTDIDVGDLGKELPDAVDVANANIQVAMSEDPDLARYRTFTQHIQRRLKALLRDRDLATLIESKVNSVLGSKLCVSY